MSISTIFSYPVRDPEGKTYGDPKYPGNCSGLLVRDLLTFYRPRKVMDPAEGSGTTGDVCRELGIQYTGLDLRNDDFTGEVAESETFKRIHGFDLQSDGVPESADLIFFHPPYGSMYKYSRIWGNGDPRDLSLIPDWRDFIHALDNVVNRLYQGLRVNGRLIMLVGDKKLKGKCFSMQREMMIPGQLENICIKAQHNCSSGSKSYGGNFIPIVHEYVIITKKTDPNFMGIITTQVKTIDVRKFDGVQTWRDVVQSALETIGGAASMEQIYAAVEGHKKTEGKDYWKEKVRQTLQMGKDFVQVERGTWKLAWA